jgi:tetratricopeptide (TPR) repeat protein
MGRISISGTVWGPVSFEGDSFEGSKKRAFSRILASASLSALLLAACATHLERAKLYYSKGQEFARTYRTAEAAGFYKRALIEAGKAAGSGSSAQAFMVKGLAETGLEKWRDAEASFLRASALGFPEGQEWAADVTRLGLGISLAELGFEDAALRSLAGLLDRSTFKPVVPEAARRWLDLNLARAVNLDEKERAKGLAAIVRTLEKLVDNDFACGFHHYLLSQALGHARDYRKSFEEAAVARDLGLPSEKALRDNDLQAVFCYEALKKELPPDDWREFEALFARWTKTWGWKDARTPGWKKE